MGITLSIGGGVCSSNHWLPTGVCIEGIPQHITDKPEERSQREDEGDEGGGEGEGIHGLCFHAFW